jgi:hypothetical protein
MKKESLIITRRSFVALGAMAGLAACASPPIEPVTRAITAPTIPPLPDFYGAITDEPYPIPAVPEGILSPGLWRQEVEPYSVANGGMDPGPGNPLGARALYLFQNGVDTLYRIHGDALARELGKAVSSGCIRMLNQDAIDLHDRAIHGASVIVLPSMKPAELAGVY